MKYKYHTAVLLFSALATLAPAALLADSPPNLKHDIKWRDSGKSHPNYGGVKDVELAYNRARRQEEKQLGLAPGSLGKLDLPPQATWDRMSDDAKALYLVNAERTARAGMKPGVIGLPLAGIESHIDGISKAYGDLLHDRDLMGHKHDGTPWDRINRDPVIGGDCHEFLSRAENLSFYAGTSPIPLPIERSIYSYIYDDASSHWGHREATLLQDNALGRRANGKPRKGYGYKNNHGSKKHEGYMGFYVRSSNDKDNPDNFYEPFGHGYHYGTVVVMNMFDPVADSVTSCHYDVTLRTEDLPSANGSVKFMAVDDRATTTANDAVEIAPLKNDIGIGKGDTITIVTQPSHGSVTILDKQRIRYLPAANFSGTDSLRYRVTNSDNQTSTATIKITVRDVTPHDNGVNGAGGNGDTIGNNDSGENGDTNENTGTAGNVDVIGTVGAGSSNPWWFIALMLTVLVTPGGRNRPLLQWLRIKR